LQESLAESWWGQYDAFLRDMQEIDFDAGYHAEEHERFRLEGYELPGYFFDQDRASIAELDAITNDDESLDITRGLVAFVRTDEGDELLLFQNFSRSHVIRPGRFLFLQNHTYETTQRPGLPRIVSSLFQVTVVALIFALVNGEQYSSYYIFYGTLCFAIAYVSTLRWLYEKVTGVLLRAAGYRRRAVLVGSGKHIEDVAHALKDEVHAPVEMVGFISLTPRPDNGLRSLGRIEDVGRVLDVYRIQEVIIADPDFPQERAVELVDQCHRRAVTVRIAPSTMEILVHRAEFVPGASVPLFELRPPVFDGFDYAVKRAFGVADHVRPAASVLDRDGGVPGDVDDERVEREIGNVNESDGCEGDYETDGCRERSGRGHPGVGRGRWPDGLPLDRFTLAVGLCGTVFRRIGGSGCHSLD
jgi:hypothetical protein